MIFQINEQVAGQSQPPLRKNKVLSEFVNPMLPLELKKPGRVASQHLFLIGRVQL